MILKIRNFFDSFFLYSQRAFSEPRSSAEQLVRPGITSKNASFVCFVKSFLKSCWLIIQQFFFITFFNPLPFSFPAFVRFVND
jgi:hypothetical protein